MLEPILPAQHADRDVVGQIKLAFSNRLPLVIGALIGALVPLATYTVGHAELRQAGWGSLPGAIVVGGCLFSAITVYKWGRRAFDCPLKAIGFVVLSEGVMTFSQTTWLSALVLAFLVAINAVANGANLAVAHLDAEARRAASQGLLVVAPSVTVAAPSLVAVPAVAPLALPEAVPSALPEAVVSSTEPATRAARRRSKTKTETKTRSPRRVPMVLN